jgi:hypothetical protein
MDRKAIGGTQQSPRFLRCAISIAEGGRIQFYRPLLITTFFVLSFVPF